MQWTTTPRGRDASEVSIPIFCGSRAASTASCCLSSRCCCRSEAGRPVAVAAAVREARQGLGAPYLRSLATPSPLPLRRYLYQLSVRQLQVVRGRNWLAEEVVAAAVQLRPRLAMLPGVLDACCLLAELLPPMKSAPRTTALQQLRLRMSLKHSAKMMWGDASRFQDVAALPVHRRPTRTITDVVRHAGTNRDATSDHQMLSSTSTHRACDQAL